MYIYNVLYKITDIPTQCIYTNKQTKELYLVHEFLHPGSYEVQS